MQTAILLCTARQSNIQGFCSQLSLQLGFIQGIAFGIKGRLKLIFSVSDDLCLLCGAGLAEEVSHACWQALGECAHGFVGGFFGFFRSGIDGGQYQIFQHFFIGQVIIL